MDIEHVKNQVPKGFWWLYKKLYVEFDKVTVLGTSLMKRAKDFGCENPVLIPNGVDTDIFVEKKYEEGLAKSLGISKKNKVIITVSRLSHKNNVEGLIESMKYLGDAFRLLIVGDGELKDKLHEKAKGDSRITFTGNVEYKELPKYFSLADVFVRASHTESFGNSFVEAMSCGVPVIGTRVGGIPDFLKDGETGLFCETNGKSIAKKIKLLIEDEKSYDRIKEKSTALSNRYSWEDISKKVGEELDHLMNKKILLITGIYPPEIGGPATYVKMLQEELPKRGFNVHVLTLGDIKNTDDVSYISRKKGFFARSWKIKRFIEKGDFDIVFAQTPFSVGFGVALARTKAKKVLKVVGDNVWEISQDILGVTDGVLDFQKNRYSFRIELMRKIEYWTVKQYDSVITPSHYLSTLIQGWGTPLKKITVIYNAVDIPPIKYSKESIRKREGISGNAVLTVGRIIPVKGIEFLIDFFSKRNEQFIIIGDGNLLEKLKKKAAPFKNIHFKGRLPREKVYEFMKASDCVILNSEIEGLPFALIEAILIGTKVVGSNVGGIPEVVIPGITGELFKRNNAKSLNSALKKVKSPSNVKDFSIVKNINKTCEVLLK